MTEMFRVQAVKFVEIGSEGGGRGGLQWERAVLCGRGDVVDGRWFAAHVERDFCGAGDDVVERGDEGGVAGWKRGRGGGGGGGTTASGRYGGIFAGGRYMEVGDGTGGCGGGGGRLSDKWADHGVER